MKKTLGGDRVGSGAKMNVDLHGYGSSTHDLSTTIATTMTIGTYIPIHHSLVMAGDEREIDLDALLMTHPTEGPLFGSFKLQIDVFRADIRLYIAKLHMNLVQTGLDMSQIKMPLIYMEADKINWANNPSNQQINPSCIFRYLHMSGLGDTTDSSKPGRYFNAVPYLMYWDVYKEYVANKQEKRGVVIHNGTSGAQILDVKGGQSGNVPRSIYEYASGRAGADSRIFSNYEIVVAYNGNVAPRAQDVTLYTAGYKDKGNIFEIFQNVANTPPSGGSSGFLKGTSPRPDWIGSTVNWWMLGQNPEYLTPKLVDFGLEAIDDMKMNILSAIKSTTPYIINKDSDAPYGLPLRQNTAGWWSKLSPQEGLGIKTYQSDLFNNWLHTETIDGANGVNARSAIQTDEEGKFTIDNFIIKEKLYNYLNRIAVAGATVEDMMQVTYDVKSRTRSEIPTYEGGYSDELIFERVTSNTGTAEQPLGTIAGKGGLSGRVKGGKIRIHNDDTQHAYYMVFASLTPRLKYSQGNGWGTNLKTYEDIFKPAFNEIGFQDLITDQMAYFDTKTTNGGQLTTKTAGKQPAWINYQTEIDRVFGNFAEQNSEGWMVLDRNYSWLETEQRIKDVTTYIDPSKYNGIFAYNALDAQNIWAQFSVKDIAKRKMSANQIPRM